jgi:23S rRNA (guanosine2251-2'-O)-methyltransferase
MKAIPQGSRLVIGRNSVRELLAWRPERVSKILLAKGKGSPDFDLPHKLVEMLDFDAITKLSNSDSHQGIAAIVKDTCSSENFKTKLKTLEQAERALVLILATVQDPHHLGAAFRAAEVFGVDLLIFGQNNSVGLTPSATKAAVGATELVDFSQVANVNEAIRKLKQANFWIVAAEPDIDKGIKLNAFDFPAKTAIVFGAEGQGLARLTKELSDFQVYIPQTGKIDSLSLSQAISIFLYQASSIKNAESA